MLKLNKYKFFCVIFVLLFVSGLIFGIFILKPKYNTVDFFSMDTAVSIKIVNNPVVEYENEIKRLNKIFSAYDKNSELYSINHLKSDKNISFDMTEIIEQSNSLSREYSNKVDITAGKLTELWGISTDNPKIPSEIEISDALSGVNYKSLKIRDKKLINPDNALLDFGSVAKGYACDKIKTLFDKNKVTCGIVSMGSSSLLYGKKQDKSPFSIEIKNPDGNGALGYIKTPQTFVSTSGGYERFFEVNGQKYIHIFNLETGYPVDSDIVSVTVLCDSGIKSDFLSTLVFIDGKEGLKNHLSAKDYKIVVATDDKKVYASDGINFTLDKSSDYSMGVI